jgi:hypothetical protein
MMKEFFISAACLAFLLWFFFSLLYALFAAFFSGQWWGYPIAGLFAWLISYFWPDDLWHKRYRLAAFDPSSSRAARIIAPGTRRWKSRLRYLAAMTSTRSRPSRS